MKRLKSILALLLVCVITLSLVGCGDTSWVYKGNGTTIPAGVYLYYTFQSYSEAQEKLDSNSTDEESDDESSEEESKPEVKFEDNTVVGVSAPQWVKDKAEQRCKEFLAVEEMMEKYNLSLTSGEITSAQNDATNYWSTYGTQMEGYGISKDSYCTATSLLTAKKLAIFRSIYGEEGTSPVEDKDLEEAFLAEYTAFDVIQVYLLDSSYSRLADAVVEEINIGLEAVVEAINSGEKDFDTAAAEFAEEFSSYSPVYDSLSLKEPADTFTDGIVAALESGKVNEAQLVDEYYLYGLVVKRNIEDHLYQLEENRESYLVDFKTDEFDEMITDAGKELIFGSINSSALNRYNYKRFEDAL